MKQTGSVTINDDFNDDQGEKSFVVVGDKSLLEVHVTCNQARLPRCPGSLVRAITL